MKFFAEIFRRDFFSDYNKLKGYTFRLEIKPRFGIRYRSEAQKPVAKRAVGGILRRRHIHRYVEE